MLDFYNKTLIHWTHFLVFFCDPLISKSVLIPNKLRNTFVSKGEGSHQKYIKQQYPYSLGYVFSKGPFTII